MTVQTSGVLNIQFDLFTDLRGEVQDRLNDLEAVMEELGFQIQEVECSVHYQHISQQAPVETYVSMRDLYTGNHQQQEQQTTYNSYSNSNPTVQEQVVYTKYSR